MTDYHIIWITGSSCDGCTVSLLGDINVARIEDLLTGSHPDLPRVRLVHPLLSVESGREFMEIMEQAERGDLGPFTLVIESAIPAVLPAGSYASVGGIDVGEWIRRLAAVAEAVIAFGDCAVYGGPHSGDELNPTGSKGVLNLLGIRYQSSAGLPVIHLPGCSAPPVLISTLARIIRWRKGEGEPVELDSLGRPTFAYGDRF